MKTLKIGKLKLKNPLVLAPMVDVTDLPFRLLCRRAGAGLAFTEMIYVDAILHENEKTNQMMKTCKEDSPRGLQITGNDVKEFEDFVSRKKLWKGFDLIDLNCGCPSARIVGTKAGSFLLKEPEKIAAMIRILKKTGKPISVKIRLGHLKNNVLETAKKIEEAGADAITVHARLSNEPYGKKADWSWLARVKQEVKIPVIGNGDVFTGEDAGKVLEICDGVMIARGAIGNPLVFGRILDFLGAHPARGHARNDSESYSHVTHSPALKSVGTKNKVYATGRSEPTWGEVDFFGENFKMFKEYLKLEKKYFGEKADFGKIKYVGGKFLRGFAGASQKRDEFMKVKNWEEIERFLKTL